MIKYFVIFSTLILVNCGPTVELSVLSQQQESAQKTNSTKGKAGKKKGKRAVATGKMLDKPASSHKVEGIVRDAERESFDDGC